MYSVKHGPAHSDSYGLDVRLDVHTDSGFTLDRYLYATLGFVSASSNQCHYLALTRFSVPLRHCPSSARYTYPSGKHMFTSNYYCPWALNTFAYLIGLLFSSANH
jgi:hypothetical protein